MNSDTIDYVLNHPQPKTMDDDLHEQLQAMARHRADTKATDADRT